MTEYERLVKRQCHDHGSIWTSKEPAVQKMFSELGADERLQPGTLKRMSEQTGINYKTLESWRAGLRSGKLTYPPPVPPGAYKHDGRKIPPDIEREIAEYLRTKVIAEQRACPRSYLKRIIERRCQKHGLAITVGWPLVDGFLERHGLSLRVPHVKRRTSPNDQAVAAFLAQMDAVMDQFPPCLIFNIDETCWRFINGRFKTLAEKGATEVTVKAKSDPKTDITVIAACSPSGDKLPLWILARGKTTKCETKFIEHPKLRHAISSHQLVVYHSPDGWSTSDVMIHYLQWLRERVKERTFHILWDLHASHRNKEVVEWAGQHDIGLTFIPAGQTDTWQPLDCKIFGQLKKIAQSLFEHQIDDDNEFESCDLVDAIVVLLQAWNQIPKEQIIRSWSAFE